MIRTAGGLEIEKSGVVTRTTWPELSETAKFGSPEYSAVTRAESRGVVVMVATNFVLPLASVVTVCVTGSGGRPPSRKKVTPPASAGVFTEVVTVAVAVMVAP